MDNPTLALQQDLVDIHTSPVALYMVLEIPSDQEDEVLMLGFTV
jgi:hypothetical protein